MKHHILKISGLQLETIFYNTELDPLVIYNHFSIL